MPKAASRNILSERLMVDVCWAERNCVFFFFQNLLTVVSTLQKFCAHYLSIIYEA